MAVFGSLIINRQIKQLLSIDDVTSPDALTLVEKLSAGGKDVADKVLAAMPKAAENHKKLMRQICDAILINKSADLFIEEMDSDDTDVRNMAKDVLSESQSFNPTVILNKLTDPNASITQLIDVIQFQKEHLKPEQIISQAFKLKGEHSSRLFDMATEVVDKFDINNFDIQPSKIDSPDKKLHLMNFLGLVRHSKSADIVSQFICDKNHMVAIAAMNSLKKINQPFDVVPLLDNLDQMKSGEKKIALSLIKSLATNDIVNMLSPFLTSKDEEVKNIVAQMIVARATTDSFKSVIIGIQKKNQWEQDDAINFLVDCAHGDLSEVAKPLLKDENNSIKQIATRFIDASADSGSYQDTTHAAFSDDWQIQAKALDILANTRQKESLKILAKVFKEKPSSAILVLKAITKLGFSKGLEVAVRGLSFDEAAVQRESLKTIKELTIQKHAENMQSVLLTKIPALKMVVRDTAEEVLNDIHESFKTTALPSNITQLLQSEVQVESTQVSTAIVDAIEDAKESAYDTFNLDKLEKGYVWAGRYEIEREIGRGAMGRVLLAFDNMVEETIIVKFMHPELTADKAARTRFIRELKYARKISHPNVIRIHDFLYQQNVQAISMEYFKSDGLDDLLKKKKTLDKIEGLKILSQIAAGMQAAHDQDVIHRDLKPSNVLINDEGVVKVVDFGIASATADLDVNLTKTGTIIGTPAYLSPERAKGMEADFRADIYALGIISFYLFTGELPYKGEPMSILFQHIKGEAEMVHVKNKEIPPKISFLVKKMMAVNMDDRYQTMDDVKFAIDKLINANI